MSSYRGKFVWYDLMTTDVAGAEAFYRDVVGWGAEDSGMPASASPYMLFKAGDHPVAGLVAAPAEVIERGAAPCWVGYVAVDDVDAAAETVGELGGFVYHPPEDIPGVGRFAIVADPEGVRFNLFKPDDNGQRPRLAPGAPGSIGWRELYAVDLNAAWAFYSALFGWTKADAMDMGDMGVYQMFAVGGETLGGTMTKPAPMPAPRWTFYFVVDRIEAAADRVKAAGGRVVSGPHQVPGGTWIVQCLDPQGALFALTAPAA